MVRREEVVFTDVAREEGIDAEDRRVCLAAALRQVRTKTLWLLDQVDEEFLKVRVHDFYSPIGWHFGHVGRTEEHWVLCKALGRPAHDDSLSFLFADLPENPKDNRVNLPSREQIKEYLALTRDRTLDSLDQADLAPGNPFLEDGYAWEFAIQHECQHQETISEMLQLIQKARKAGPEGVEPIPWRPGTTNRMVGFEGGRFSIGSACVHHYDNEKDPHEVEVAAFDLAARPVSAYDWTEFIKAGGYHDPSLWSDEGWKWRQRESAERPEYWLPDEGYFYYGPLGVRAIHPDEPVSCLSWYEAEAYCQWCGYRMPTEAEWEIAATSDGRTKPYPWGDAPAAGRAVHGISSWGPVPGAANSQTESGLFDIAGNVWEWTNSKFLPYPGFRAFPYDGYSKDHMKGEHFVCRGGSWATAEPILRCSFRNWYVPSYRQGFLGLRCAR